MTTQIMAMQLFLGATSDLKWYDDNWKVGKNKVHNLQNHLQHCSHMLTI